MAEKDWATQSCKNEMNENWRFKNETLGIKSYEANLMKLRGKDKGERKIKELRVKVRLKFEKKTKISDKA